MRNRAYVVSGAKRAKRGGGLVLHGPAARVVVHFGNFRRADHLELIEFFREVLGEDIQEGWDRFAYLWLANGEPGTFRLTR